MFTTLWANTYSGCLNQILGVEENRSKPYNFLNWKHSTGYRASGLSRKAACSRRAGLPRKPWRVRDEYSGGFLRGSCGNVRERVGGWTCVDLRERIRIRILKKMICQAQKKSLLCNLFGRCTSIRMLSTLHTRDDSEAQTSFGLIGQNKTKQTNNFTPMEDTNAANFQFYNYRVRMRVGDKCKRYRS